MEGDKFKIMAKVDRMDDGRWRMERPLFDRLSIPK